MSVALEVCDITRRAIGARSPRSVVEVVVDVGETSGIEAGNLEFCLGALLQSPPFGAAQASIRRLPGDVLRVSHVEVEECP